MAGIPTLVQVQNQWDQLVILSEKIRRWADDEIITLLENLEASTVGNYTPQGFAGYSSSTRVGFQSLITGARIAGGHQPMLYEFGTIIESPYRDILFIFRDVYDYLHENALNVPSRELTYGIPAAVGSPDGDGFVSRLTRDWNDYDMEAIRTEEKTLVCRVDLNSGSREHAEVFEIHGTQASIDSLQLHTFGTGVRGTVTSRHAGNGVGGSMLKNSSFSQFSGGVMSGWEMAGVVATDPIFYRSYPGATVDQSALMDSGSALTQAISVSINSLDVNTPYFLRVMVNAGQHGASGGFNLKLGSVTVNVADVSALTTVNGWAEVVIPFDRSAWFRTFNEHDLSVKISFNGSGKLIVDDMLFTPWDIIDGSYLLIRGGPTSWLLDDEYRFADSQADITKGLRSYWTYLGGLGYLPNTSRGAAVGWADPTIP